MCIPFLGGHKYFLWGPAHFSDPATSTHATPIHDLFMVGQVNSLGHKITEFIKLILLIINRAFLLSCNKKEIKSKTILVDEVKKL